MVGEDKTCDTLYQEILRKSQFTGNNYSSYILKIKLLFTYAELMSVVTEPKPTSRRELEEWEKANKKATLYLVSTMVENLQRTYISYTNAKEIYDSLENKYGKMSMAHSQGLWSRFISTKMKEGGDIRDHVHEMIATSVELNASGHKLSDKQIIFTIIESLPPTYDYLKKISTYSPQDWSVESFMEKVNADYDQQKLKGKPVVHVAEGNTTKHFLGPRKTNFKKKGKKNFQKGGKKKPQNKGNGKKENDGKCFFCKEAGHQKKNCAKFKTWLENKQGIPELVLLHELNLTLIRPDSWWADTGASAHVSCDFQGFVNLRRIDNEDSFVLMGNEAKAKIKGQGDYKLCLKGSKTFILQNCLYVPSLRKNLLSVSCLDSLGFTFFFGNNKFKMFLDDVVVLDGFLCKGLYQISLEGKLIHDSMVIETMSPTQLWHHRLGHIGI